MFMFRANSTTSEPSRVINGRHSVQSVALGDSFWGAKRPFDKQAMSAFQRTSPAAIVGLDHRQGNPMFVPVKRAGPGCLNRILRFDKWSVCRG